MTRIFNPEREVFGAPNQVVRSSSHSEIISADGQVTISSLTVPGNAAAYTVTFAFLAGLPLTAMNQPVKTEADIEWIVSGTRALRRVSVVDGMSISGIANAVRVTTKTRGTPSIPFPLGIMISPGLRPNVQRPALLDFPEVIVPAQSSTGIGFLTGVGGISTYVTAWISDLSAALAPLDTQVAQTIPVTNTPLRGWDPYFPSFVPLVAGAYGVMFWNYHATKSVTFSMSLGIDG